MYATRQLQLYFSVLYGYVFRRLYGDTRTNDYHRRVGNACCDTDYRHALWQFAQSDKRNGRKNTRVHKNQIIQIEQR